MDIADNYKSAIVNDVISGARRYLGKAVETPATVAWFMWVEAVAVIRAGVATANEPNGAPIEIIVNG